MARQRRIKVHGVRRETPDLRRLGRAAIEMVQAQTEADAAAEHAHRAQQPQSAPPAMDGQDTSGSTSTSPSADEQEAS